MATWTTMNYFRVITFSTVSLSWKNHVVWCPEKITYFQPARRRFAPGCLGWVPLPGWMLQPHGPGTVGVHNQFSQFPSNDLRCYLHQDSVLKEVLPNVPGSSGSTFNSSQVQLPFFVAMQTKYLKRVVLLKRSAANPRPMLVIWAPSSELRHRTSDRRRDASALPKAIHPLPKRSIISAEGGASQWHGPVETCSARLTKNLGVMETPKSCTTFWRKYQTGIHCKWSGLYCAVFPYHHFDRIST